MADGNLRLAYRLRGLRGLLDALGDYWTWRRGGRTPVTPVGPDNSSRLEWLVAYEHLRPDHPRTDLRFSVILDARMGPDSDLSPTIGSLLAQTHSDWVLTVIGSRSLQQRDFPDHRVRFRADPILPGAFEATVREESPHHVVVLLPGDTLRPDALEWLSSVATDSDLVYSDGGPSDAPNSSVFKPAWSPRLMLTTGYLDGLVSIARDAFLEAGGLGQTAAGNGLAELILRLAEIPSLQVTHLPLVLQSRDGVDSGRLETGRISRTLERRGWQDYEVSSGSDNHPSILFTDRRVFGIKVVIPTRDRLEEMERAIDSVFDADGVGLTQLVVVDNGSTDRRTLDYLDSIGQGDQVTVVRVDEPFNFSRLCNIGAAIGPRSPYLLFLNNDIAAPDRRWMRQLAGWLANDESIAAVTPQLRYPDGTVQYGGTVLGMGGIAGHYGVHLEPSTPGLHQHAREVAAVTAACLLVRTTDFESVRGFSEDLPTDFQDVDFSLELREKGRVLMYDPTYPLTHLEGATRGRKDVEPETQRTFLSRWGKAIEAGDPYYSPHLADGRWDSPRGWVHNPNALRDLPETDEEARRRVRPRRST